MVGSVTTDRWSPVSNNQPLQDAPDGGLRLPAISLESLAEPLSAIAFWLAIALPVLYIPFVTTGINGVRQLSLFLAVFGLHVTALYTGHSYRTE